MLAAFSLSWLIQLHPYNDSKFKVIEWDVSLYYTYLPATFIYNDIKIEKDWGYNIEEHQFILSENAAGVKYHKVTSGMAIMYSPFFALGHLYAKVFTPEIANGYSTPYRAALSFGSLFYILMGLWFLRKVLLYFFNDSAVAWTLAIIFLGTNLLHYTVWRGAMSHGYSFALSCFLFFVALRYKKEQRTWQILVVGFTAGLMVLIRPVNALMPIVVGMYLLLNILNGKLKFSPRHWVFMFAMSFIAILPQLLYWKYATGNWIIYSYGDETFFFNDPKIINGLFSFRKGWLLYTPLMALSMFGMWPLYKINKVLSILLTVMLVFAIYIAFSWWCWWYGGSFGSRPMIDYYGFLAIPIAASVQYFMRKKTVVKTVFGTVVILLIALSVFQNHQYQKGLIHPDAMTEKTYKIIFLETGYPNGFLKSFKELDYKVDALKFPKGYWKSLDYPDYEAAKKGERD